MRWCALLALASGVAGCGDLSNEDLLFLAGLPRAEEVAVAVQPEAAQSNALTGLVGELATTYGLAAGVAGNLDSVVVDALQFVETLGWGYPPTHRSDDTRVWGPVRDVDGKAITMRLEIRREDSSDDNPLFSFCLHAGPDALVSSDASPDCSTPSEGGLRLLVWGSLQPRASADEGRAARGLLKVNFEAVHAIDPSSEANGLLVIGYDFSAGGERRAIHMEWVQVLDAAGFATLHSQYDFATNPSGDVLFQYELATDLFAPFGIVGSTLPESLTVAACWKGKGDGLARVAVSGGDIPGDEIASAAECWDENHRRTFWRMAVAPFDYSEEEGDSSQCLAECPEI